jgi:hypothetical protein
MKPATEWTMYRCEVDGRFRRDPASDPFDPPGTIRWTRLPRFALEFTSAAEAEAFHPGATARPFKRNSYGFTIEIEP